MVNLEQYINEYLIVCKLLQEKGYKLPYLKNHIAVERSKFEEILKKNNYDDVRNKLKIWKNLKWLESEKTRYTKIVKIEKKSKRMIVVDITPSHILLKIPYNGKIESYTSKS